jgi:hypothetical protein
MGSAAILGNVDKILKMLSAFRLTYIDPLLQVVGEIIQWLLAIGRDMAGS